ncbi:sodium:proton antiporter [soil metagenome]
MRQFDLVAILLVLAAGFSYLNYRLLKLPSTIGLMALTLGASILLVAVGQFVPVLPREAEVFVRRIDFSDAVLHGLLGFLLFAGALHVKLDDLARWCMPIAVLATVGVVLSTLLVGGFTWLVFVTVGVEARPVYCLLFGALIAPTDPIAVLGLLKQFGAPKALEVKIAGESLFNDGVAVAVFLGLLAFTTVHESPTFLSVTTHFLRDAGGGVAYGLAIGWVAYRLFKSVDNYQVEVLLSLALVAGGYAGAEHLHVSAPIAMVVAGLLVGNQGRSYAMSSTTVERLDDFWELIDEILNAILFVLLGLEVLVLTFTSRLLVAGLLSIVVVLAARFVAVGLPVLVMRRWRVFEPYTIRIMTWGGLRGGLSVAMALSIPAIIADTVVPERDVILAVTYVVVGFSILVQGLTVGPLVRHWIPCRTESQNPIIATDSVTVL